MAEGSSYTDFGNIKNVDDDSGITMLDVLEEEKELEDDANAVLGGSDDQNCTYPQGYIRRQALYACETCMEGTEKFAGVCLACCYACHDGHKLFELYTKRNFRCDCGNSKFTKNQCKLYPEKSGTNTNNNYNQNFGGLYCICCRPYPDPDDEIEDEMIQCVVCEDWYHGRHLGTPVPSNNEYGEMICSNCMMKCDFLWAYDINSSETVKIDSDTEMLTVNVTNDVSINSCGLIASGLSEMTKEHADTLLSQDKPRETVDSRTSSGGCLRLELLKREVRCQPGCAVFWADGWREKLCRCDDCKKLYMERNVLFLLDNEDTVHSYEEQGKAQSSGQSRYDQGMQALSRLDRVRQVEAIHEYNDMTSELKDFFKNFAESKKVVRKEDIDEFFNQMRARKRQKVDVSVQPFCR